LNETKTKPKTSLRGDYGRRQIITSIPTTSELSMSYKEKAGELLLSCPLDITPYSYKLKIV